MQTNCKCFAIVTVHFMWLITSVTGYVSISCVLYTETRPYATRYKLSASLVLCEQNIGYKNWDLTFYVLYIYLGILQNNHPLDKRLFTKRNSIFPGLYFYRKTSDATVSSFFTTYIKRFRDRIRYSKQFSFYGKWPHLGSSLKLETQWDKRVKLRFVVDWAVSRKPVSD